MEKNPTVYIVLPVYNGEKYFLEQLMSIYHQVYQNWYLIIINDGSTDSSEYIVKKFIKDYSLHNKVKILKKENGGLNSAIQKGLEEVNKMCNNNKSDDLVAYCDCDDIWTRNKLLFQVEYMVNHPECGLSYHNLSLINEYGELITKSLLGDNHYHNGNFMYVGTMRIYCITGTIMFKSKYIDDILPMPKQPGMAQDMWTSLVLSLLKIEIHYFNEVLFFYRKSSTGLQCTLESKPKNIQNQIRMNYFIFLKERFPDMDIVSYVYQYNYDRLIKRPNKGYSLIIIYLLMLFEYPKIFFLGVRNILYGKFLLK